MAIASGAAIDFFGTKDDLDNTSAAVSDGAFSVAAGLDEWTNDDDALFASVMFEGTFASNPAADGVVNLYVQLLNIDGTNDAPVPDANYKHDLVGIFHVDAVTSAQFITEIIQLKNDKTSQQYQYYIGNESGQQLSAGWIIHPTPKAVGPHAA